jgi:hypothetical protein
MYPIMSFFARRAGGVDAIVITCMVVQLTCHMAIYMAYGMFSSLGTSTPTNILFFCGTGSLQVILVENVPENGPMGTVNGIAQMLGSGDEVDCSNFCFLSFLDIPSARVSRWKYGILYSPCDDLRFKPSFSHAPKQVKAKRRST